MTGSPDDPSDLPTGMAHYVTDGARQQVLLDDRPDTATPRETAPEPWYRNRVLLALWAVLVALLLGLIGYGIVELSRDDGDQRRSPSTTSTTTPQNSSTGSTSATPSTTTPSATTPSPSDATPPAQAPAEAPPPANDSPGQNEPPLHHHHHPHVPSTITLPHTVVTLPHGF